MFLSEFGSNPKPSFVVIKMPPSLFKNPRFLIFSNTGGNHFLPTPPFDSESLLNLGVTQNPMYLPKSNLI